MANARMGITEVGGKKRVRIYIVVGVTTLVLDVAEAEQLGAELTRAVARGRTALAAARFEKVKRAADTQGAAAPGKDLVTA